MRKLSEITIALIQSALTISSPALISWTAYLISPNLGLAGLGVGMVAGPFITIKLFDKISEAIS